MILILKLLFAILVAICSGSIFFIWKEYQTFRKSEQSTNASIIHRLIIVAIALFACVIFATIMIFSFMFLFMNITLS